MNLLAILTTSKETHVTNSLIQDYKLYSALNIINISGAQIKINQGKYFLVHVMLVTQTNKSKTPLWQELTHCQNTHFTQVELSYKSSLCSL